MLPSIADYCTEQDKEEERARKAEEKAAKDEEKRLAKEKRHSQKAVAKEPATGTDTAAATESAVAAEPSSTESSPKTDKSSDLRPVSPRPAAVRTSMEDQASLRMRENADAANPEDSTPLSPTKDGGKVKSWLKRFSGRRSSKAQKPTSDLTDRKDSDKSSSFIGGAALTGASKSDVALAGKSKESLPMERESETAVEREPEPVVRREDKAEVSSVSSLSNDGEVEEEEEEEFLEARDNFDEDLAPPPTFVAKSSSPARSARFTEEI